MVDFLFALIEHHTAHASAVTSGDVIGSTVDHVTVAFITTCFVFSCKTHSRALTSRHNDIIVFYIAKRLTYLLTYLLTYRSFDPATSNDHANDY